MSHTVNVNDCKGLEFATVFASDSSDDKKLNAVIIPERDELRYDVLHEKKVIFTGPKLLKPLTHIMLSLAFIANVSNKKTIKEQS